MKHFLRSAASIVVGMVAGFVLIGGIEWVNTVLYPPPPGLDFMDPKQAGAVQAYLKTLPAQAFLIVVLAESLGAFVASWIAARLANRARFTHGMIIAALFLLATLLNLVSFPHPPWMWFVAPAGVLAAAYLGTRLASGRLMIASPFK